jgi:nicotinate-nucleotide adenylyltransferase
MKMLYFGGSFNPVHLGHLICARHAAEAAGFDGVTLVPSANPPHKSASTDLAPAADRLRMCRLAVDGHAGFDVDDLETRRTGPSYTIDTARTLAAQTGRRVSWLIGGDMVRTLPSWHEPDALLAEVDFVVLARPGWAFDWHALPEPLQALRANVVEAPLIQISATEIRRRVRAGLPIDFLTPAPVVDYIRTAGLYRAG